MDSSSSGPPGREASLGDDDGGGHISVTAALARDAAHLFQARRFSECYDVLKQLLQKKEDDPKILHNIAIAEYYRDGCSDPRKILDVLNKVKKRSEDLARASGEQGEIATTTGSGVITGPKGSNPTSHHFSSASGSSFTFADEYDSSIATLNLAVLYFHLHDYAKALSILEPSYQNIAPIDETTALHICLLLLDVALASNDASKAADVIQYLEKAFGVGYMIGQVDSGTAQHLSSNQAAKASTAPANLPIPDASNPDSASTASGSENQLTRTLSDEGLEYEALLSKLDSGGENMARPSISSQNALAERPGPALDLKLKLHLYKVRLLLLTRNLKSTKREVKLAMNIARGRDSSTALLLKSQLEYARGNYRKAIKLLENSSNRTEAGMRSLFNNNFGCIYHQMRKHNTATLFFSKALASSSTLRSEKPLKLSNLSQDKSLLIVYNCGIQYLSCGKPLVAARCFHKAGLVFYNRPLLWLRLAECCLVALETGLLKSEGMASTDVVTLNVVGKGKWRQEVVENVSSRSRHLGQVQEDGLVCSDHGQQRLSLPYARQCLLNALHLLNSLEIKSSSGSISEDELSPVGSGSVKSANHRSVHGDSKGSSNTALSSGHPSANGDSKEAKGNVGPNITLQSSVTAYEELCRKENHMIKQAVLADLAYVELCLENPLKALSTARALLQVQDCSRIYAFLANVYAAEALCLLDRSKEAAELLSAYVSGSTNVELPYSEEDREMWRIEKPGGVTDGEEMNGTAGPATTPKEYSQGITFLKPEESRGILQVNLAAICAMQGDMELARQFMAQALSVTPNNPVAVLGAAYVDLVQGQKKEALVKLKQCSRVRFQRSDVRAH
ncbi:hypothetical protein H6P81_000694 [Aristolochia fimbriata]|uniref:CCR4-NOT transcription complex subunit 10 n=1 Tax=Aristolochia fimbriata TaxID=158543 RepID=A0AAV7F648_ARIFI|nr:hypothetical protein H6P81_000694 [Aristolochia fimbriata]